MQNKLKKNNKVDQFFFLINSGFGLGLLPKAPGTFGTLLGFGIYFLIAEVSLGYFLIVSLVSFLVSLFLIQRTKHLFEKIDDSKIVIDEYYAFALLLYFIPSELNYWLVAFILFRLFDIFKPLGIKQIDQLLKNPLGIMLDDLLAAFYSYIMIYLYILITPFLLN